jgi:ankyrin repeat protein
MAISMRALNCLQGGRTPLHIACQSGHAEVVFVLLTAGAALEDQDQVSAVGGDEMIDESESYSL